MKETRGVIVCVPASSDVSPKIFCFLKMIFFFIDEHTSQRTKHGNYEIKREPIQQLSYLVAHPVFKDN